MCCRLPRRNVRLRYLLLRRSCRGYARGAGVALAAREDGVVGIIANDEIQWQICTPSLQMVGLFTHLPPSTHVLALGPRHPPPLLVFWTCRSSQLIQQCVGEPCRLDASDPDGLADPLERDFVGAVVRTESTLDERCASTCTRAPTHASSSTSASSK